VTFRLFELMRLITAIRLEDPELWRQILEFAEKRRNCYALALFSYPR
jgi:hypothetical protein